MKPDTDVLIIGGGLAGLISAIHLRKNNIGVTLIEKSSYPRHKVCGEYISNEVLPYLKWLGINVEILKPTAITKFEFTDVTGKRTKAQLKTGGFGASRYTLDNYLYEEAINSGTTILKDTVTDITFKNDVFTVQISGKALTSEVVIGAYGKRSNIDQALSRKFIKKKSPWLAVKAHYTGSFNGDTVAIHNFNGGYCGISKVENDKINICYLADYKTFKSYKNIAEYQNNVLYKNPNLKAIFESSTILFDKPITISQINFNEKEPVVNHIIMTGDTAGLIHPLCGNGMAMAIHSAKIASDAVTDYFNGIFKSRQQLESRYISAWKKEFSNRLSTGRLLAKLLQNTKLTNLLMRAITLFPGILQFIIKQTHGKPMVIKK